MSATNRDAWRRAVRTWLGGLVAAVLVNVTPAALALAGTIEWTAAYWAAEGQLIGTLALSGAISYAFRHMYPPRE